MTGRRPELLADRSARLDYLSGLVFLAFGGAFAIASPPYGLGSLLRMGPGYLPFVLGLTLCGLGVIIILTRLVSQLRGGTADSADAAVPADDDPDALAASDPGAIPWARGAVILAALLLFGFLVPGIGLGPAIFLICLLSALVGHGNGPRAAVLIALGLTVLCIVVFVLVLQLRLPIIGPWLGG